MYRVYLFVFLSRNLSVYSEVHNISMDCFTTNEELDLYLIDFYYAIIVLFT